MRLDPAAVLCDLDGVVWLAHHPIPGSVEAIADLRRSGRRVVFVTNNSSARIADQEAALASVGIPATGDVLTSAVAAAALVEPGERVLACGGVGVVEAITARGAVAVAGDDPSGEQVDAVVVGLHRQFDYERMRIAATAVRRGARFIATNMDPTFPTPNGPVPGAGAIVAAVSTVAGRSPVIAGKPHPPMATAVGLLLDGIPPERLLVVGDRLDTDGAFAIALGCPFALVRTGVTAPGVPVDTPLAADQPDLAAVVDAILQAGG